MGSLTIGDDPKETLEMGGFSRGVPTVAGTDPMRTSTEHPDD